MSARLRVGGVTDVGLMRPANEDALFRDDESRRFAVADGMGGHRAGDVASATALEAFDSLTRDGADIADAIRAANSAVWEKAQADPDLRGMGTTVTALRVDGGTGRIGHVGDSRAYLLRGGELTRVTDDHSLVEELVREGRLTPEQAAVHPQRSIITRALGVDAEVDVDTYDIDLVAGDRLLLCSDGLTSMVGDKRILELLRSHDDPQEAAQALVDAANAGGGEDNVTVLIVDVEGGDDGGATRAASDAVAATPAPETTGEWERPSDLQEEPDEARRAEGTARPGPAKGGSGAGPGGAAGRSGRGVPWKRLILFALPVLVVLAVAVGALAWYARSTYFVGLDGEEVALYQGVPGGLLGWDPTVEERSELTADDLTVQDRTDLEDGHQFSDRSDAEAFIAQLEREAEQRAERRAERSTTTTSSGPTTTTAP